MNKDELLNKLAQLADTLDDMEAIKVSDEVDELLRDVNRLAKKEDADIEANLTVCDRCDGEGGTDEEAFCPSCRGSGFIATKEASLTKTAFIRKRDGKWCVISKKNKVLGCHPTRKKALQQLRAVEWAKSRA